MGFGMVLCVFALGAAQVAAGIAIGRGLAKRSVRVSRDRQEKWFSEVATRLSNSIQGMTDEVGKHQKELRQYTEELEIAAIEQPSQEAAPQRAADMVVQVIERIVKSNEWLQNKLDAAECKLREQREQMEQYLKSASVDPLTRLANRRAFDKALSSQLTHCDREHSTFAVIMIDVDRFKSLNDRFGHLAGDQALREISDILRRNAADGETLARIGGEEIAFVLPNLEREEACRRAEEMRISVAERLFPDEREEMRRTISLGVATFLEGDNGSSIIDRADRALYAAKQSGRNCTFFNDGQRCTRVGAVDYGRTGEDDLSQICDELRLKVEQLSQ